jgi:thiol-disulfide isomerase/thioredoxin
MSNRIVRAAAALRSSRAALDPSNCSLVPVTGRRCALSELGARARGVVLMIALAVAPGFAGSAIASGIPWRTNLEEATVIARETNQPVLVDFWADWCGPCIVMEREVFSDDQVIRSMSKVVPVRLHVDHAQDIVRRFEIAGPPTMVLLDGYGTELFRFTGQLGAATVLALLRELPGDISAINAYSRALSANADDFSALAGLGHELRSHRLYRASNEQFRRALRTKEGRVRTAARGLVLVASGRNALALEAADEAERSFAQYLKEFPSGELRMDAAAGLEEARAQKRAARQAR